MAARMAAMPPLTLYTTCLAAICAHSFYTGVRLALAVLVLRLTHSPAAVGVVMMAYALLPALLSPRIGRVIDRRGVRPVLLVALSVLASCGLALWSLPLHTTILTVGALFVGLGFNAFAVSIQKLIGGLPPSAAHTSLTPAQWRKRCFGTLATASSISSFVGPLLAGWGLDRWPAGSVFGLLSVLPALGCVLVLGWPRPQGAATAAQGAPMAQTAGPRSPWLQRELWPLAVVIVMMTVAGDAAGFITPILGGQMGLSATAVGGVVSAFALGSFVIRLMSAGFIAKLPEWHYMSLALLGCATTLLLFAQATSALGLTMLSFTLGLWLGLAQPMTQTLLHQQVPEHRVGEALGARLALVGSAQTAGPLLMGLGAQAMGAGPTLMVTCLFLVAGGVTAARSAVNPEVRRT